MSGTCRACGGFVFSGLIHTCKADTPGPIIAPLRPVFERPGEPRLPAHTICRNCSGSGRDPCMGFATCTCGGTGRIL